MVNSISNEPQPNWNTPVLPLNGSHSSLRPSTDLENPETHSTHAGQPQYGYMWLHLKTEAALDDWN